MQALEDLIEAAVWVDALLAEEVAIGGVEQMEVEELVDEQL